MEANRQIEDNLQNGKEYARIIKTLYQNLMLERQVLRTKERPIEHRLFLPQEVVQCEVWIHGFQRRHNYKQQSPWKDAVKYSPKCVGVVYFSTAICGLES